MLYSAYTAHLCLQSFLFRINIQQPRYLSKFSLSSPESRDVIENDAETTDWALCNHPFTPGMGPNKLLSSLPLRYEEISASLSNIVVVINVSLAVLNNDTVWVSGGDMHVAWPNHSITSYSSVYSALVHDLPFL